MGNNQSSSIFTNKSDITPEIQPCDWRILDYVAVHYIFSNNFETLRKLNQKEYCDNLMLLTKDVLTKYFSNKDIRLLEKRITQGNGMIIDDANNDANVAATTKAKICTQIAKFYVKIAHIFAAIITTINPMYIYTDATGNKIQESLLDAYRNGRLVPENDAVIATNSNLCGSRVDILQGKTEETTATATGEAIKLPNVGRRGFAILQNEPGIPELRNLYFDENYDAETGQFLSMSVENQKQFDEDLRLFYEVFTGGKSMPDNISDFSDISLNDALLNINDFPIKDTLTELKETKKSGVMQKLLTNYAKNIREMTHRMKQGQYELFQILNQLFIFVDENDDTKREPEQKIRIHPDLTQEKLQNIVEETRQIIVQLYLNCEMDYAKGVKLYEAILEQKIFETTQRQIEHLEKLRDEISLR